jgi:hypothetical protein
VRKAEVSMRSHNRDDVPFGSGDGGTKRLGGRDTGLGHHVVARIEVLAFLRRVRSLNTEGAVSGRADQLRGGAHPSLARASHSGPAMMERAGV